MDRGIDNLTTGEDAYLDVLSDLVEKYETEHHPIPDASSLDVLKFLMEDRGTNQRAVALGSGIAVSTMSEIMARRRQVNLDHMQRLAAFFRVPVSVFVPKAGPMEDHSEHRRHRILAQIQNGLKRGTGSD